MRLAYLACLVLLIAPAIYVFDIISERAINGMQPYWWHFMLAFYRLPVIGCYTKNSWKEMDPDVQIRDDQCHSWEDGKTFSVYAFQWERNFWKIDPKKEPDVYGNCTIYLYEHTDCGGRVVLYTPEANRMRNFQMCFDGDKHGILAPARSVPMQCNKPHPW